MTLIIIKQCGLLTLNIINYVIILHINLLCDIVSYYIMTLIININLINAEIIAPFSSFLLREKIVLSQDNFCVGGDIQGGGRYISQGISPSRGAILWKILLHRVKVTIEPRVIKSTRLMN